MDSRDQRIQELKSQIKHLERDIAILAERSDSITHLNVQTEEKFRHIFNNANDAIILWEANTEGAPGKCLEVNKVFLELTGYTADEAKLLMADDLRASESNQYRRPTSSADKIRFEVLLKCKSGDKIPTEVNAHRFELNGKRVILAIHRDVTERKEFENRIIEE